MSNGWNDGYDTAVKEYEPMLRECEKTEDALTKIIMDLIAQLRKQHKRCCPSSDKRKDHECLGCRESWPCPHTRALNRAEQRLLEVQGE